MTGRGKGKDKQASTGQRERSRESLGGGMEWDGMKSTERKTNDLLVAFSQN